MTGKQLKEIRKKYGMTQAAFAKILVLETRGSVSKMESGVWEVPKRVAFIIGLLEDIRRHYEDNQSFLTRVQELIERN